MLSTPRALFALQLAAGLARGQSIACNSSASTAAATCQQFSEAYPDLTLFSNATAYTTLNEDYFSAQEWLGPACIFAPTSAEQMSYAVKTLVRSGVPFAVRGGGHMPIAGSANINSSGILLSSSGLTQLIVSEDNSTISVGPGNRWGPVYEALEPYGLTIVGGRMGVVGVPGFLLGGGISFFGNEYGWASANIASFECVLADGTIVNATATNAYADLFWALRGGGNNFAILTNFELKTLAVPQVTVGQVAWNSSVRDQFIDSVYDFAFDGILDQKAAVTPTVSISNSTGTTYTAMLFYNGEDTAPRALENFTAPVLTQTSSTFKTRSFANWSAESVTGFERVHGLRFRFHVLSMVASREAMGAVHDIYLAAAANLTASVTGFLGTLAMMPISKSYIVNGRGDAASGDPMGIDAEKAPYIWIEESVMWALESDDAVIDQFIADVNVQLDAKLAEFNVTSPYLYLNDADKDQPVFEGYDATNVQTLKTIRDKYDPNMVYTTQMPGGFKVANA